MRPYRHVPPILLVATGSIGMILSMVALRREWPIIPESDFAKGILFGVCLGIGILGMIMMPRSKAGRKA